MLTYIDAAAASILTLITIAVVLGPTIFPQEELTTNDICYLQKVASQILRVSMTVGYTNELARLYEIGYPLTPLLIKISQLCPQNLVCSLKIYAHETNSPVACIGSIHSTIFGESSIFITTLKGKVDLICQVSRK